MKKSYLVLIRRKSYNDYPSFNRNVANMNKYMINLIVCVIQG